MNGLGSISLESAEESGNLSVGIKYGDLGSNVNNIPLSNYTCNYEVNFQ